MEATDFYQFVDTHCHINMMIKKEFDIPLTQSHILQAKDVASQALQHFIFHIINVGTSLIESKNCIQLAHAYDIMYATVGIHPNDCTPNWYSDLKELVPFIQNHATYKIVGIGEVGLDFHYPHYHKQRQIDAFKAHIELAIEHNLALVVHTRNASQETLHVLEQYRGYIDRGIIHCFSEDLFFAQTVIAWGFVLGIGGTVTYPKNESLRTVVQNTSIDHMVLETDAPFLPPQHMRGKQNHPQEIATIARYVAELKGLSIRDIAYQTSMQAYRIFGIK